MRASFPTSFARMPLPPVPCRGPPAARAYLCPPCRISSLPLHRYTCILSVLGTRRLIAADHRRERAMAIREPIPLDAIQAAAARIAASVTRTPLVRLNTADDPTEIYLKLENLQPIGSFKLRGAVNAMARASPAELAEGVWTASAGNMAQGVAWQARCLGIPCAVVAPDHAPETKLAALARLGASVVKVPFDAWFDILRTHTYPGMRGRFLHPVSDPAVMAGNATIGLEILDDLPDVDAVVIPYGGGGLSCAVASAVRARKPGVRVYSCRSEE